MSCFKMYSSLTQTYRTSILCVCVCVCRSVCLSVSFSHSLLNSLHSLYVHVSHLFIYIFVCLSVCVSVSLSLSSFLSPTPPPSIFLLLPKTYITSVLVSKLQFVQMPLPLPPPSPPPPRSFSISYSLSVHLFPPSITQGFLSLSSFSSLNFSNRRRRDLHRKDTGGIFFLFDIHPPFFSYPFDRLRVSFFLETPNPRDVSGSFHLLNFI